MTNPPPEDLLKRIPLPWSTLAATGDVNNKLFNPATGWVSAADVKRLRGTFEQRASQTNFRCTFAYQVADSDGTPGAVFELGSPLTADGFSYGTLTDVFNNTSAKQMVRFGWMVWYNTGGTPPLFGRVGGTVEYDNC